MHSTGGIATESARRQPGDEVRGYWLFALGVLLGVVGILAFVPSESAGPLRQLSVVLAATGLVLVFAGPIIRLPLERTATLLVYVGAAVCLVAVAWFVVASPYDWSPQTGQPTIVVLYSVGLLAMGIGACSLPRRDRAVD
jgi:predicted membrane channel-forming protein YqfA (hemolysin III family)